MMLQPNLALSGTRNVGSGGGALAPGNYWISNAYQAPLGAQVATGNLSDGVSGDQSTYIAYTPAVGVEANITIFRVWSTPQALNTVTIRALLGESLNAWEIERWTGSAWSNDIKTGVPATPANFAPTWSTLTQNLNPALTTTMLRVSVKSRTDGESGPGDGPVLRIGDLRTT